MKTFDEVLKKSIDDAPFTPGLDDGSYKEGFVDGLEYAQELIDKHKNNAINEILTKYHEWASNIPAMRFAKWENEEGDFDKTKARIRKEFIEYLKREQ